MRVIIQLSMAAGILGIVEILLIKDSVWVTLPMVKFQENKGTAFQFYHGVPLNYYTWDYMGFTGKVLRRMVSFFTDPLMAAGIFFLGFVLCDIMRIGKRTRKGESIYIKKYFYAFVDF